MHINTSQSWTRHLHHQKLESFYEPEERSGRKRPIVVDVHTHPVIKMRSPFNRLHVTRRPYHERPRFFPLSRRTAFNRLHEGGVHVLFSGAVASEEEFVQDMTRLSEIGIGLRLARAVQAIGNGFKHPTPMESTIRQMCKAERKMAAYNKSNFRRSYDTGSEQTLPEARVARNYGELIAALNDGHIAMIHSIEGAHSLEGKVTRKEKSNWTHDTYKEKRGTVEDVRQEVTANLEKLAACGLGYLTLGHYYPNEVAATTFSYPQRVAGLVRDKRWKHAWRDPNLGLTEIGKDVVRLMCELGVLIDVAHITPRARRDVYEIVNEVGVKSCVLASHVGAQAINPDPYNLSDEEIRWFANHRGLIGVMFSNYWLTGHDGSNLGINHITRTIQHILKLGNENIVGIGSDFDGFSDPPDDLVDSSEMFRLTQRLMVADFLERDEGLRHEQIRKIMGGNALRLLEEGWKVDARTPQPGESNPCCDD